MVSAAPTCWSCFVGLVVLFTFDLMTLSADAADVRYRKKRDGCGAGLEIRDRSVVVDGSDDVVPSSKDRPPFRQEPMCCQGKNNSCVARGARMNAPTASVCFCDSDCMTYGDCCLDYTEYCPGLTPRFLYSSYMQFLNTFSMNRELNRKMHGIKQ